MARRNVNQGAIELAIFLVAAAISFALRLLFKALELLMVLLVVFFDWFSRTPQAETSMAEEKPKAVPYKPPHNWKPPTLVAQEKAQRANLQVLSTVEPPKHFAQALSVGHEGIERCIRAGDWDTARLALQKVAYTMPDASPSDKAAFTEYMKHFAVRDPLYKKVIEKALVLVADEPGIKQTALYPRFPNVQPETIRYVLYFADQLGHIKRIKKGNTYLLHTPGERDQLG
jgi:hypothetical protein